MQGIRNFMENPRQNNVRYKDKGQLLWYRKKQGGIRNVRRRFPMLYREPIQLLCNRSTLQLLKWIETYEECWRTLNIENTIERQHLIGVIKKAFRNKNTVPGYLRLSLFGEARSIVIRRSTFFLTGWVERYKEAMTPRRAASTLQLDLGALQYCQPFAEETLDTADTRTL